MVLLPVRFTAPAATGFTVNAVKFDGSNDYIRYGNQTHYGDQFTMSCWFKRQSTTAFDTFFSTTSGMGFWFTPKVAVKTDIQFIKSGTDATYRKVLNAGIGVMF